MRKEKQYLTGALVYLLFQHFAGIQQYYLWWYSLLTIVTWLESSDPIKNNYFVFKTSYKCIRNVRFSWQCVFQLQCSRLWYWYSILIGHTSRIMYMNTILKEIYQTVLVVEVCKSKWISNDHLFRPWGHKMFLLSKIARLFFKLYYFS
jgi:hypothetical protein